MEVIADGLRLCARDDSGESGRVGLSYRLDTAEVFQQAARSAGTYSGDFQQLR